MKRPICFSEDQESNLKFDQLTEFTEDFPEALLKAVENEEEDPAFRIQKNST